MNVHWFAYCCLCLLQFDLVSLFDPMIRATCDSPLGMQSGMIPDSALTASSSSDGTYLGPHLARIRMQQGGGAWCPQYKVSLSTYEWIQIDLRALTFITKVEIQGRYGNAMAREYVEQFRIEYSRDVDFDPSKLKRYKQRNGEENIKGNVNYYHAEIRELNPPIIARTVRFIPVSKSKARHVCMRVELYGCPFSDGLLSYSFSEIPHIPDETYDGFMDKKENKMKGGLGQLTDGILGFDNYSLSSSCEWVGWKKSSGNISIEFEFESLRNFSYVYIHCNNMFKDGAEIFREAVVSFSDDGQKYRDKIEQNEPPDKNFEMARPLTISLLNHIGRFLKIDFYFTARLFLISEVIFESRQVFEEEIRADVETTESPSNIDVYDISLNRAPINSAVSFQEHPDAVFVKSKEKMVSSVAILAIVAVFCCTLFLLTSAVVLLILKQRTSRQFTRKARDASRRCCPEKETRLLNMDSSSVPCAESFFNDDTETLQESLGYQHIPDRTDSSLFIESKKRFNGKLSNGTYMYPTFNNESEVNDGREYAVPDMMSFNGSSCSPRPSSASAPLMCHYNLNSRKIPHLHCSSPRHYMTLSCLLKDSNELSSVSALDMASHCSSSVCVLAERPIHACKHLKQPSGIFEHTLDDLKSNNLKFHDKLGENEFSEIYNGEFLSSSNTSVEPIQWTKGIIKILKPTLCPLARMAFIKEMRALRLFTDPNIVKVLAICIDPPAIVFECLEYGDLYTFLREAKFNSDQCFASNCPGHSALIFMACQIASGMKYLESLNCVHRDLALRNCLVGKQYLVKIADFGVTYNKYERHYYTVENQVKLPVRWLSWEVIFGGRFSLKSGVWSFGVTLWELMTLAEYLPYNDMTDEEVILNLSHLFIGKTSSYVQLQPPQHCTKEIYDLIVQCLDRNEVQRPSFKDVHLFLSKQNLGYSPVLKNV